MPPPPCSYLDLYFEGVNAILRSEFQNILNIGLANWNVVGTHPVDWAKSHLKLLISARKIAVQRWIKEVCDTQELPETKKIEAEFEEVVFWKKWRAPKLIYMQPAGNAPYDPRTVWEREDELRTQELLAARAERFLKFLSITLEQLAGAAHVAVAQNRDYTKNPKSQPA